MSRKLLKDKYQLHHGNEDFSDPNLHELQSNRPSAIVENKNYRQHRTVPLDEDVCMDPRSFCLSPSVPQFQDSIAQAHLYNTYGMGMCGPTYLLERLGPHILRSHVSSVQFKPIPNDYSVNLDSFRYKDPREWGLDDVIGWMISVAKRHNIPIEDMNMHRFSDCNGPLLNLMTQQSFADRDAVYGPLLFAEYRRMLGDDSDQNILDKLMLTTTHSDGPGTSGLFQRASCSQSAGHHVIEKPIPISLSSCKKDLDGPDGLHHSQQPTSSHSASSTAPYASVIRPNPAALSTAGEWPAEGQLIGKSSTRPHLLAPKKKGPKPRLNDYEIKTEGVTEGALSDLGSPGSVGSGGKELKRRKDGKPRRRSQHTKGNKLWEFIRDALKDTETCPSIVKWEDPEEGVFRIVESEKLAKLWGEKKNNQKMTYEKLSRAMRTYYEKKILLPVPKTGLYPKKLVYKFGPCTHGWKAGETALVSPNSSAVAADNSASTTTSNAKVSVKSTAAIPKSIGSRIKAAQERRDSNLQLQNAGETRGTQPLATVNPPAPQYDYDNNVKAEPIDSDPDDLDDRSESGRLQIDQFDDVSSEEDNEDLVVDEME